MFLRISYDEQSPKTQQSWVSYTIIRAHLNLIILGIHYQSDLQNLNVQNWNIFGYYILWNIWRHFYHFKNETVCADEWTIAGCWLISATAFLFVQPIQLCFDNSINHSLSLCSQTSYFYFVSTLWTFKYYYCCCCMDGIHNWEVMAIQLSLYAS